MADNKLKLSVIDRFVINCPVDIDIRHNIRNCDSGSRQNGCALVVNDRGGSDNYLM